MSNKVNGSTSANYNLNQPSPKADLSPAEKLATQLDKLNKQDLQALIANLDDAELQQLATQLDKLNKKYLQSLIAKLSDNELQQLQDKSGTDNNLAVVLSKLAGKEDNLSVAESSLTISAAVVPTEASASPDLPAISSGGPVITSTVVMNLAVIISLIISNMLSSTDVQIKTQGEVWEVLQKFERLISAYSSQRKLDSAKATYDQSLVAAGQQREADLTKAEEIKFDGIKNIVAGGLSAVSLGGSLLAERIAKSNEKIKAKENELIRAEEDLSQPTKDRKNDFGNELKLEHERLKQEQLENETKLKELQKDEKLLNSNQKNELNALKQRQKDLDKLLKENESLQKDFDKGKLIGHEGEAKKNKVLQRNVEYENKLLNEQQQKQPEIEKKIEEGNNELKEIEKKRTILNKNPPADIDEQNARLDAEQKAINEKIDDLSAQHKSIDNKIANLGKPLPAAADSQNMLKELKEYNDLADTLDKSIEKRKEFVLKYVNDLHQLLSSASGAGFDFAKYGIRLDASEQDFNAQVARALTEITRSIGENSVSVTSALDDQLKESLRAKKDEMLQILAKALEILEALLGALRTSTGNS